MDTTRQIIISREDHERLENLFDNHPARTFGDTPSLRSLRGELDTAALISPEEVPADVVTMNSTVRLCDSRSSYLDTYTLVYPEDVGVADSNLSVLVPVGAAILGYRVGDLVQWPIPNGTALFRIKELVFQPERDSIVMKTHRFSFSSNQTGITSMATKRLIIISKEDHERLENLFFSRFAAAFSDKTYLQSLRRELDIAKIVTPEEIPPDVVTMNSTVRMRSIRSKEVETYTLVYPQDANIAEGKLSVLAPIGTAILGYRVGDTVQWQVPSGLIRFKIEELVFQPERDGVVA